MHKHGIHNDHPADDVYSRAKFNSLLAVDADTQLIAAVAITNSGSDMGQMSPMNLDIQQRYATAPDHWLVQCFVLFAA